MYCTSETGSGGSCTSTPDPAYQALPIGSTEIAGFKSDASSGGVVSGNYTVSVLGATLGPKEIDGDLTVPAGATLTLSGPLYVTGDLVVAGTGSIILSSSFSLNSGVIVVDGTISVSGAGTIAGSGSSGSVLMLLSGHAGSAISYAGSGDAILYAPSGTVALTGSASAKAAAGMTVTLSDTAAIAYDEHLLDTVFASGSGTPPGILSWKETR